MDALKACANAYGEAIKRLHAAQARIAELEDLQRRHEGAVQAAYFAAWNECTQYVERAAHAARAVNPETILTLMGEHQ
jgi:uncharacterized protein YukE